MKRNKAVLCLMIACIALMLSGCRFALEEKAGLKDRFVGVSVLLLPDGTMGDEIDRSAPHEPDGRLLTLDFRRGEDGEAQIGSNADDWFADVHQGYHVSDSGEECTLEATMYVCSELLPANVILELERVYQREDGSVYALQGGNRYGGNLDGLGLTLTESSRMSDSEGNSEEISVQVRLNVETRAQVIFAEIVDMSTGYEELARYPVLGGEELTLSGEWALLEETLASGSVRRTAFNRSEDEWADLRTAGEDGVCRNATVRLNWQ